MNETIKAFLQKLAEDNELAAKFNACKTADEAFAVASGAAEGFTKEEFISAMEQFKASVENTGDLSDEDLSKFAGGDIDWSDVGEGASVSFVSVTIPLSAIMASI